MGRHVVRPERAAWYACHTKPRCEKKFAELMQRESLENYLPLVESVRVYGQRRKVFTKPLFAGYVFVRIEPALTARIYQQDLIVRALPVENEALFLAQIEDVRRVCASGLAASLQPLVTRGTRVRVTEGPLRHLEGFVDDPQNPGGIVVSFDVLQKGVLVRLPIESLLPLP